MRLRTREKLQLIGVVVAGALAGILVGWILTRLLLIH